MNRIGLLVGAFGVLILIAGLGMPATQTNTSTTCIDSQYGYGDGCVQADYTTPNFGRGIFIALGFALTIGGGLAATMLSESSDNDPGANQSETGRSKEEFDSNTEAGQTSLESRIEQYQDGNN
ncbi:hypothetical protein [Halorhabdus sp. SVX81]|uniref:hypothetical protein n=1 Tax=Halorhabdus sp. SVX81 TaxID=2978283 RepID=UPI0023DBD024|nr:hypothetical protein [Halorhabdus sp. SVX81]